MKNLKVALFTISVFIFALSACGIQPGSQGLASTAPGTNISAGKYTLHFVIGSENRAVMDDIVIPWFAQQKAPDGTNWKADYMVLGSVDQKILLQSGNVVDANGIAFNVIWPANKTWSLIGDTHHLLVDNPSPVFYTPIVLAWPVSSPIEQLAWKGKSISLDDVMAQVQAGRPLDEQFDPKQQWRNFWYWYLEQVCRE